MIKKINPQPNIDKNTILSYHLSINKQSSKGGLKMAKRKIEVVAEKTKNGMLFSYSLVDLNEGKPVVIKKRNQLIIYFDLKMKLPEFTGRGKMAVLKAVAYLLKKWRGPCKKQFVALGEFIMEKTTAFLTGFYSHCEKNGNMVNCADLPEDWRAPELKPNHIPEDVFK